MVDDGFWPADPTPADPARGDPSREDVKSDDAPEDDEARDDAALAVAARHALHDEELVAAYATGSLEEDAEVDRARSLVERCTACRDLHRDVAAIGDALRVDARGTMPAPRDFRLTVDDALRLGGTVRVRGLRAAFRRTFAAFTAPIGASMAALGIVGLLVGSAALGGQSAAAPNAGGVGSSATSAPAEMQTDETQPGPKSSDRTAAYGPGSSAYATQVGTPTPRDSAAVGPNPAVWLLAGSLTLLVAGVVLLFVTFRRGRT